MVGIIKGPGINYTLGKAYIAIPSDLDRAEYIRDCYVNHWVSLRTEDGGFMNRIRISPDVLNSIEFPTDAHDLGTPVMYGTDQVSNYPMVLTAFAKNDHYGDLKEHQFKVGRRFGDCVVEISGSPKEGALNLQVSGGERGSKMNINLFSEEVNSELNIDVKGKVTVRGQDDLTLATQNKTIIETFDNDEEGSAKLEQGPEQHLFSNKKFIINGDNEAFMLGNTFKKLFDELIDELAKTTTTTVIGQMPILNAAQVAAFKARTHTILSKVGFIDK